MTNISSVFKSVLLNKYSSIQDTNVDYGNTDITADYSVEDMNLSLTSSTSDNTSIFDANIADLTSSKETFVKLQDLSTKELENIDSIINKANQENNLVNRYNGLSFQSKGGYGPTMQAAQGELKQVKVDLDNSIKANSTYSSYQELLDTQKQIGDIDKYCEEMIVYYDRQIKWQEYYKIYNSEECQKSSIEGMLGEKEYHDNISNNTFRGEEYTKLLEIRTIGNYDDKLKELFGDDYQEQFASYGLDFQFDYLKMYNYLYQTQGEEAAKEFYAFAEDNINSIDGLVHALYAIKDLKTDAEIMEAATNYFQVHAKGVGDGVVGSLEGVVAWFSDNRSRSASSYETMWYSMMLETGKYGKGQVFNYQVGQGTGQMLPVMLIGCLCPESLIVADLASVTGGTVGTILLSNGTIASLSLSQLATSGYLLMSSGGRDYKEQMINGKTREEAILHGLLSGTTEVTTEHLLGGLPFLSETNVYNLRSYFTAMGKEGFQEVIQDMISEFLLGDGIPNFSSEAERDAYWDQWAKEKLMTFAVAAFSAGELQGGNLAMSKINLRNINTQIDKGIVTEQELVDLIKEQYPTETMDLSNEEIIGEYNGQIAKYIELKLEALLKMSPETSTDNTPIEENNFTFDESMADSTILKGQASNITNGLSAALTNIMNNNFCSKVDAINILGKIIQYNDYNILYNQTSQNMTQYSFTAIEKVFKSFLRNYNNQLANNIEISINGMMDKGYSEEQAISIIEGYAKGKYDIRYITRTNNARNIINNLDAKEIELGLNNYNKIKQNMNSINNMVYIMKNNNPNLSTQDCLAKIEAFIQLKDPNLIRPAFNVIKNTDFSTLSEALGRIQFKTLGENLKRLSKSDFFTIIDLKKSLMSNVLNDSEIVYLICNGLSNQMIEGNKEASQIAKRITEIMKSGNMVTFESIDHSSNHWSKDNNAVRIGKYTVDINGFSSVMHETGHMFFYKVLNEVLPTDFTKVITSAQKRVTTFNYSNSPYNVYINNIRAEVNGRAKDIFRQYLTDAGMTELEYRKQLRSKYSNTNNPIQELSDYMEKRGKKLSKKTIDALTKSYSVTKMVQAHINGDLSEIENRLVRTQYPAYSAISDTMDALFLGKSMDLSGKPINKSYGHFEKYYNRSTIDIANRYSFHEMIANYNLLKATNNIEGLELLRNTFGQEFYNMLENTYQGMVYGSLPNTSNSSNINNTPSDEVIEDSISIDEPTISSINEERITKLEQRIIDKVNDVESSLISKGEKMSELQKARLVYYELGRKVDYSEYAKYLQKYDKEGFSSYYKTKKTFSDIEKDPSIICVHWAHLYAKTLIDLGFDEKRIVIQRIIKDGNHIEGSHASIYIILEDGSIIMPELTMPFGSFVDAYNVKVNNETMGFIVFTPDQIAEVVEAAKSSEGGKKTKLTNLVHQIKEHEQECSSYYKISEEDINDKTHTSLEPDVKLFIDTIGEFVFAKDGNPNKEGDRLKIQRKLFSHIRKNSNIILRDEADNIINTIKKDISEFIIIAKDKAEKAGVLTNLFKEQVNRLELDSSFLCLDDIQKKNMIDIKNYITQQLNVNGLSKSPSTDGTYVEVGRPTTVIKDGNPQQITTKIQLTSSFGIVPLTIYKDFGSENINNYKDIAEYTVTIEDDKIQVRKSTPLYSHVLDKLVDDSISLDERAIYEKIKPSMTEAEIKALPDILYKNGRINNKYVIQIEGTEISIIRKLDTDG